MRRRLVRFTAKVMILVLGYQLVVPVTKVFALTSGPSQPEVQSFEPVGTTEMVDLFSGDFVYNIPLMDIEGYPVNISYHSGINMEQEASWVGLGWNINPGEINRGVRGIPDDFKGDKVNKVLNIKPEKDYRLRLGVNAGFELFGGVSLGISTGQFISYNNYKGVGIGMDLGAQLSTPIASAGVGVSVGSLEGASVNANAGLTFSTSKTEAAYSGSISFSGSTGFNTRSGLKDIGVGVNVGLKNNTDKNQGGIGFGSSIPIGLQNYVAVVTNPSVLEAYSVQVKLGVEIMWGYPNFNTTLSWSKLSHEQNSSLPAYGYLYSQNAEDNGIVDFSREKDGVYNSTLPNLPLSSMTYDIYNVSGQGTGGMFRPFRSDIGSVFDPLVSSSTASNNFSMEFGIGVGPVGGLFEFGTDVTVFRSKVESGPWNRRKFKENAKKSLFENAYFKQGGEMTYSLQQDAAGIAGQGAVYADASGQLKNSAGASLGQVPATYSTPENRSARANNLSFITNSEVTIPGVTTNKRKASYPRNNFFFADNAIQYLHRTGTMVNKAKGHHIAEVTQTGTDGRRYIYGLPAMNNFQKEVTFSVEESNRNLATGLVKFSAQEDSRTNATGRDHYFQATYTPAYAHSYLLTAVLSSDYSDINDDGPTEDDLGSYTKFNYSLSDSDYRWIAPYQAMQGNDSAQYNPGFWSDNRDDKGNYVIGSKETWYLHSVESKNFIAEFYTSPREDGRGVLKAPVSSGDFTNADIDGYLLGNKSAPSLSYKLDSIKLFNKHDRLVNQGNATPIKTVIFTYDYSLCPNAPNNSGNAVIQNGVNINSAKGKLTLKRIYFRYGKSDKSLLNPYVFTYDGQNNVPYSFALKDRWGNYKRLDPTVTNYEFPYVKQNKPEADSISSSWHLAEIKLPSGGRLKIKYEADDYSYVQNKRTMEMFKIAGVGSSSSYEPKDVLYENIDHQYDYIYFKRDQAREIPGMTMRQKYLEGSDMVYFSFNVDIAGRNRYEHIKGYAKVADVGICSNDNAYGYIKVERENAGGSSGKQLNPITLAGLNTGRYYLPHIIYPGYNEEEPGAGEVLKGLLAATQELLTITQNANERFVKNGLAKKIIIPKSWIRLNTPSYTKIGGGTRVKELKLEDSWDQMVQNGTEAAYGRTYDYTTLLDNNTKISSGVASYEPMIGADENPLRQPISYTAESGRLMPAIEFFQETPLGESFYPSPTVGYSKVTVRSINKDIANSAKAEDIYEFYTAKDFPIECSFTAKSTPVNTKHRTLTNKEEELQVLQGYELRLNDMHGKAKAISNYVIKPDNINRELITSTRYNYQVDNKGKLDNTVKAVKRNQLVQPSYSVTNMKLGEEVDFTIDSRKREMESNSLTIAFNLNVVNFAIISIPIPTVFFPDLHEQSQFKTMVSTKVVQQYGILKSVEAIDHGARTLSENVLYDSETGQVLLTKVNNEFDDPIHNLTYPSYWAYDNMGPSYYNIGYEEKVDSAYVDNCNRAHLIGIGNKRHFNPGDELLMQYTFDGEQFNRRVYVVSTGTFNEPVCGGPPGNPADSCTIIVEPNMKTSTGAPTWIWNFGGDKFYNVHVKVLRSGRRNMLGSSVQQLTVNGDFPVNTFNDLFNSPKFGIGGSNSSALIAATAATYRDDGLNNEFPDRGLHRTFRFSSYLNGVKGNWRPWASYSWKGARNYTSNHARKDGTFSTYQQFWQLGMLPDDAGSCSMQDYIMYPSNQPGWQKLKEVIAYNSYGLPIEEIDAAGIPSTALYANNYTLPIAVATNARNKQLKYLSFEDLMQIQNLNKWKFAIFPTLEYAQPPIGQPATIIENYGKKYFTPVATDYVTNAVVTNAMSHSGSYSLYFSSAGSVRIARVPEFSSVQHAHISMWVKVNNGAVPSTLQTQILATGKDANSNPISQSFTAFSVKTGNINGWYKLEGRIDLSLLSPYTDISISVPTGYYLDDIRMIPDEANMKSFAYDLFTHRLMAELDENNFATFYEYDQEGVLVRVKKESDRGILTVNEHRKANAKRIQ